TRQGALALIVVPTERHLAEVRAHVPILSIAADKRDQVLERLRDHFVLAGERLMHFEMELDGEDLRDLIEMSPSRWHLGHGDRARLASLPHLRVTASFDLLLLERNGS